MLFYFFDSEMEDAPTPTMWTLLRALVVALALAGLVGQSGAYAMPPASHVQAAAVMTDCADMPGMADPDPSGPDQPCPDLTPACMVKMGCAAPVAVLPAAVGTPVPAVAMVRLPADLQRSPDEVQVAGILGPPRPRV